MHELSLSKGMLESALKAARQNKGELCTLNIKVGALSSASPEALQFCMEMVLENHGLEGVEVNIEETPARARCECGHGDTVDDLFEGCPRCGSFHREILEGQEVTLESIEVENGKD
ncbi:MAG: hydrogenase maturation nickel metallochaperone HypA [Candidatus Brocadiia bacterium]